MRDGSGRLIPMAAALAGVAAIGLLVAAVLADRDVTITAPVLVGDIGVVAANNSPEVARNPTNPDNLVVVNRVDRPQFSAAVNATTDGGRTWTTAVPPLPRGLDRPYAPSAAFGTDGTLYLTYVNLVGRGNRPERLWIATSEDGGRTFSEPVEVAREYVFQSRLAIDRTTGTLHVTWLDAEELSLLAFDGAPVIMTSHSTDGGQSWSDPVRISDPGRPRVGAAVPVVTGDGELVVVYEDFKDDRRDFQNLEGPPYDGTFAYVVTRSTDGGETFSDGVEFEAEVRPTERFLPFLPAFPSVAVHGRELLVAWSDGRNGDRDVFLRRSPDGGRSWTEPVRVNRNPIGDGTTQTLPAVDVAPSGRIDVLYLDGRADTTGVMSRASLSFSRDGGANFDTIFVSPSSFDTRIGPRAASFLPADFGSRQAVLSASDGAFVAWTDTELGTETTGRQDVATRRVTIPDPFVSPPTAVVGALVLLATGFALLWWWRRGSRRRRSPAASGAVADHGVV